MDEISRARQIWWLLRLALCYCLLILVLKIAPGLDWRGRLILIGIDELAKMIEERHE